MTISFTRYKSGEWAHCLPTQVESWPALFALWDAGTRSKAKSKIKDDLPGWSPATFKGPGKTCKCTSYEHRTKANVVAAYALVLEYDNATTDPIDKAKKLLIKKPIAPAEALALWPGSLLNIYTTWNHSGTWPRFRLVLPTSRPVSESEYAALWQWAWKRLLDAGHAAPPGQETAVDPACKDASRFWYWPARSSEAFECITQDGAALDTDTILASLPPQPTPSSRKQTKHKSQDDRPYGLIALDEECDKLRAAPFGTRHNTLTQAAFRIGQLAGGSELTKQTALNALEVAFQGWNEPSKHVKTLHDCFAAGFAEPRSAPKADHDPHPEIDITREPEGFAIEFVEPSDSTPTSLRSPPAIPPPNSPQPADSPPPPSATTTPAHPRRNLTDLGNAERLRDTFGTDLRYVPLWSKWLVWDGTRFSIDDMKRVTFLAEVVAKRIMREVALESDTRIKKAIARWSKQSEASARVQAMLLLAQPLLATTPAALDRNPWLLNCANGTINLETGKLQAHDRKDLITKTTATAFDPHALCPLYDKFLSEVQPDPGVRRFLDQLDGYSLTGVIREHIFVQHYGVGRNGKGTKLEIKREVLGDYAVKIPAETLCVKKGGSSHPTDRATFFGKRFALASETGHNAVLDVALVNELTGGDTISCRRMREDFWTYAPSHKLEIQTNHKLTVHETSLGIWARMALVPWLADFSDPAKADTQLPTKLKAEAAGILARFVRGCLDWQAHGLVRPQVVIDASREYQNDSDVLGAFLAECTEAGPQYKCPAKDIYAAYLSWAKDHGEYEMSQTKLGRFLVERGFKRQKSSTVTWLGLQIRAGKTPPPAPRQYTPEEQVEMLVDAQTQAREVARMVSVMTTTTIANSPTSTTTLDYDAMSEEELYALSALAEAEAEEKLKNGN